MIASACRPLLRNLNERTVLEAIRAGAPISRAEISRRSGISKPTVSVALQSLLEASLGARGDRATRRLATAPPTSEPVTDAAARPRARPSARASSAARLRPRRHDRGHGRTSSCRCSQVVPEAAPGDRAPAHRRCLARLGPRPRTAWTASSSACPSVVEGRADCSTRRERRGARGPRVRGLSSSALDLPVTSRTTSTSPRSASSGRASRAGSATSSSSRSEPAWAQASSSAASSTAGRHGAAGEIDFALVGVDESLGPSALEIAKKLAARSRARQGRRPRHLSAGAANGDEGARAVVHEIARRIALTPRAGRRGCGGHVELVVLGGGIGANGDLLLRSGRAIATTECDPSSRRASRSRPLGAAVLTGALARRPAGRPSENACAIFAAATCSQAESVSDRAGSASLRSRTRPRPCSPAPVRIRPFSPASACRARPERRVLEPWGARMCRSTHLFAAWHSISSEAARRRLAATRPRARRGPPRARRPASYGWRSIASHVPDWDHSESRAFVVATPLCDESVRTSLGEERPAGGGTPWRACDPQCRRLGRAHLGHRQPLLRSAAISSSERSSPCVSRSTRYCPSTRIARRSTKRSRRSHSWSTISTYGASGRCLILRSSTRLRRPLWRDTTDDRRRRPAAPRRRPHCSTAAYPDPRAHQLLRVADLQLGVSDLPVGSGHPRASPRRRTPPDRSRSPLRGVLDGEG